MGLQTTRFHVAPYRTDNENLRKFGATYRHGALFAPKRCSYQKKAMGKESQKKCKPCVDTIRVQTCTGLQTTRFHAAPYRADNENLRKLGATYRSGSMFAYLYQKEALGKENSKM